MTAAPMSRFPGRPNGPFMWGRGGRRMTPEDLTLQRRLAASQLASGADYSPVGHWTQGLARAASGLAGGVNMRRADRAAERNAAETSEVMQALLAGGEPVEGGADPVAAALANPYISDEARRLALNVWESRQPKAPNPTEFERLLTARGIEPGTQDWNTALDRYISGKSDPQVTVTLPGGGIFVGPQSELATVLQGGGGRTSGAAPGGAPAQPPAEAIAELRQNPSTAAQFDEVFGPGAAEAALAGQALNAAAQSNTITPEDAARVRESLGPNGQAAFQQWMRRNNITIESR